MTAGTYNITIEQGADWATLLSLYTDEAKTTPKDISAYTGKMQIRLSKRDPTVIKEISSGAGLTIGGTDDNEIALVIASADTTLFNFITAYYDLELTTGGVVSRLIEGTVTLSFEVTR